MSNEGKLFAVNYLNGEGVILEGDDVLVFTHHFDRCNDGVSKCWSINGKYMRREKVTSKLLGDYPSKWRYMAVELYLSMPKEFKDQIVKIGDETHPPFNLVIIRLIPLTHRSLN